MMVDPNSLIPCAMPGIYAVSPLYAFVVTTLLIPLLIWVSKKSGFVDKPDERKQHIGVVPPVGGIGIFLIFMLFLIFSGFGVSALFLALAIILLVGLIDDSRGMNAKIKFLCHFLAAIILVVGAGAQIKTLGGVLGFGQLYLGVFSIPFSVACVVYILNAINMMDGMDGLAGGNSLIILGWLAVGALDKGECTALLQIVTLMASIAGFLLFNFRMPWLKQAKVFLGDTGSMALGLMIAWYAIHLSQGTVVALKPISVAWIIALPIVDSFGLLVARVLDGKRPFDPDRRHFHHHFLNAGFTPQVATPVILLWSFILGAVGFLGPRVGVPEGLLGWGWIAFWLGHTVLVIKKDAFIAALSYFSAKTPRQL